MASVGPNIHHHSGQPGHAGPKQWKLSAWRSMWVAAVLRRSVLVRYRGSLALRVGRRNPTVGSTFTAVHTHNPTLGFGENGEMGAEGGVLSLCPHDDARQVTYISRRFQAFSFSSGLVVSPTTCLGTVCWSLHASARNRIGCKRVPDGLLLVRLACSLRVQAFWDVPPRGPHSGHHQERRCSCAELRSRRWV